MKKTFTILIAAIAAILMMAQPGKVMGQTRGEVTDAMTAGDLAATSTSYTNFTNVTLSSTAVYAGNSAKTNTGAIQLRSNSNSGIVSTTSGGKIRTVTITVASGSNTIQVYGKNTAYTGASQLYNNNTKGTLLGSTSSTGTITVTGDYDYVGIRSNSGAVYISQIDFVWDDGNSGSTTHTLSSAVTPTGAGTVALSKTSLEKDETATATATANAHFSFTSWSIAGEGATLSSPTTNPTTVTMGTANATVTATFTEDPIYNITYNANYAGSTDEPVVFSEYAGESVTIAPYSTFTRAGYAITSWNTAPEGNGTPYSAGDPYTMTSAGLTLYAQWEESNEVVDVLTASWTGVTSNQYSEWSDKSIQNGSGAVYAGRTSNNNGIGLRTSNSNEGIITTTSGGFVRKVSVDWISTTNRNVQVYGKNSAYSSVTDLFNNDEKGTLLGTIVYGTSTEILVEGDYAFVGIRSASSALVVEPIRITWELDNDPAVTTSITINDENINNDCGNSNINGGTLSATVYDNQNTAIEGATVTWESSETSVATINATTGAVTLRSVGTTTITARYAGIENEYKPAEATYTLNVIDSYAPGGSHNPFSVAEARDFIDGLNGEMSDEVYVTGIISQIDEYISNYKSITYWISDNGTNTDQLEVYSGKGINGANFTSINDLQLKDEVVVKGNLKLHNNSIYEFNYNNQLVSLIRKTITVTPASIEATSVQTVGNLSITTENMTISDLSDFSVQYYDNQGQEINDPGWITFGEFSGNGDSFSVGYTIATTTEARNAYFKVFTYSDEIYSNLINVSQAAPASTEYYQYSINGIEGDLFQTTTGTEIELPATVNNIPSGFTFAGWTIDADDIEHIIAGGTNYTINTTVEFYAVFAKNVPVTFSYTIVPNDFSGNSYASNDDEHSVTATSSSGVATKTVSYTSSNVMKNNTSGVLTIQWKKDNNNPGEIYNESSYGTITSVEVEETSTEALTIVIGESVHPTEASNNGGYFSIKNNGSNTGRASSVTITFIQSVPYYYTRVFPANPTVTGPITITGPTVITSGTVLDMGNYELTNTNAANLIIEDGGVLVTKSSDVKATVKKNVAAAAAWGEQAPEHPYTPNGWYFIASPVNTTSYATALTTGTEEDYDLYMLDWANKKWLNKKVAANSSAFGEGFTRGKGYLYASKAGNTLSVAGTIQPLSNDNNATVTLANDGWNLIGNPLTCKVTVDHDFGMLNNGSTIDYTGTTVNPFQGIVVWGSLDETVTFTKATSQNAAAPSNNNSLQMTLSQTVTTRGVESSKVVDNAVVSFSNNSGMPKFNMLGGNAKLYIPQNGEDYAIAFSNRQGDMPLNFKTTEAGMYTISFEGDNMDLKGVSLIDMLAEEEIDLSVDPSYTFIGSPADKAERFKIVFSPSTGSGADIFAYQSGSDIIVSGEGELQIFDVMGRKVKTQYVSGVQTVNVNAQGVYIMKLNEKTQKIIVR